MNRDLLTGLAVLPVLAYYVRVWTRVDAHKKSDAIVTVYSPPRDLSPAMIRYIWKERFDDRTFWAATLSLVAKGLATLESVDGITVMRATDAAGSATVPNEESYLLDVLIHPKRKKTVTINMLDPVTQYVAIELAGALRRAAVGRWFLDNQSYVMTGAVLSILPVWTSVLPHTLEQWGAFLMGMGVMAPGTYYMTFLLPRVLQLMRAARGEALWLAVRRFLMVFGLLLPCVSGVAIGSVVLGANFGWHVLAVTGFMIGINLALLAFMKLPTPEGRKLLNEITGFRRFLASVEKYPMDRTEGPNRDPGAYEKYLPYAVALEVEQSWSDRLLALASTTTAAVPGARTFYLGMWNGSPVEIVLAPQRSLRPGS